VAAVPAEANALAGLEKWHVRPDCVDGAGDLVTRSARKLDAGPMALFG
jgi:hypothetical protein